MWWTHIANEEWMNAFVCLYCEYVDGTAKGTSFGECLCSCLLSFPQMLVNWANIKRCSFLANYCVDENSLSMTNYQINGKARYTLFVNRTNREQTPFFAEQNTVYEKKANVLLYTVCCSSSIFSWTYSPLEARTNFFFLTKNSLMFVEETTTSTQILRTAYGKNLFAKHGEHLLYTIRCTSLFSYFVLVSSLFANSV